MIKWSDETIKAIALKFDTLQGLLIKHGLMEDGLAFFYLICIETTAR